MNIISSTAHSTIPVRTEVERSKFNRVLDGYNVLVFAADGVGNSYFVIKNEMEALGATVTTIGLSRFHTSCSNVEDPVLIETSTTIKDFDIVTIKDYEALIIPSGGYWFSMLIQDTLMEFIEFAYENDLLIASLCIGMIILSGTSIVEGVRMVAHDIATTYLQEAGADMEYYARVVYDHGIVSGGIGGGLDGGRYLSAPHKDLCLTLARRILNYSYMSTADLVKEGSNYSIILGMNDVEEVTNENSNISKVETKIYDTNNTLVNTIDLRLEDSSYKGEITGLENGKYTIRIVVKTTDEIIEISRDLLSITIGNTISGYEFLPSFLSLLALIAGTFVVRRKH